MGSIRGGRRRDGTLAGIAAGIALAALGCQGDRVQSSAGRANLRLQVEWRGRTDDVFPSKRAPRAFTITRIDLQVHRTFGDRDSLLTSASAPIPPGQGEFRFEVEVPAGGGTSVEIGAFGSEANDGTPETGFLFFGRATGITVGTEEQTVTVVLDPYVPRLQGAGTLLRGWRLAWSPIAGADRYRVRVSSPLGGERDSTLTGTTAIFPASPPPVPERLAFRVRAENAFFVGAFSDSVEIPRARRPTPPGEVTGEEQAPLAVLVRWRDASEDEDGFAVFRQGPEGGDFDSLGSAAPDSVRFVDRGPLVPGGRYRYAVRSFQGDLRSDPALSGPVDLRPPAPGGLAAVPGGTDRILLTWEPPGFGILDEFVIDRRAPGADFQEVGREPRAGPNAFLDTGLQPRTTYDYRVRSVSHGVVSEEAAEGSARTYPPAPVDFAAQVSPQRTALLSWAYPPPPPDAFFLYRRDASLGSPFALLDSLGGTITQYEDRGLQPRRTYVYLLRAKDGGVLSPPTDSVAVAIPAAPPNPPTNLAATAIATDRITVTWTDNSDDETRFTVERRGPLDTDFAAIAQLPPDTEVYGDPGLEPRTVYAYRVRVTGPGGEALSNEASDRTFPPAPEALRWTDEDRSSLSFTWIYPGADPDRFLPEIRLHDAPTWTALGPIGGRFRATTVGNLLTRQLYDFRLAASEAGDTSPFTATLTAATAPPPPDWVSADYSPFTGLVALVWSFPSQPDPDQFEIERRKLPAADFAPLSVNPVPGTARAAADPDVERLATYQYRIRAFDLAGSPPDSVASGFALIEVSTSGPPPNPPTGLIATARSATDLDLTWTDASNDETAFLLERRGPSDDFVQIAALEANTTIYADRDLDPRTTYEYRVRAEGANGHSGYSNVASDRTWPPAPSPVYLSAADSASLTFTWEYPDPPPERFRPESREPGALLWTILDPLTAPPARLTGLAPRQTHQFRVRAEEMGDVSAYSPIAVGRTAPPTPLWSALNLGTGANEILLQWSFHHPDPSRFEIERRFLPGPDFAPIASSPVVGAVRSTVDNYSASGVTIEYRLRAVDETGSAQGPVASRWSHAQLVVPGPPGIPQNVDVRRRPAGLEVTWTDGGGGPVLSYEVWRKRPQDDDFSFLVTVSAPQAQYVDVSVNPARTYAYRLRAYGPGGYSDFSASDAATTPGWRRIVTEGNASRPSSRTGHAGTLVPNPSRVYVYGEAMTKSPSEMWVYSIADSVWTLITPNAPPEARSHASMAYSPEHDLILLFGGTYDPGAATPFYYDPSQNVWSQPCNGNEPYPSSSLGPRSVWMSAVGAFLSIGGLFYAGDDVYWSMPRNHQPVADSCYALDGQDPANGRAWPVLVPISGSQALVYGGLSYGGVRDDVWILQWTDSSWSWQQVAPSSYPGSRYQADATYDSFSGRIYVLGGSDDVYVPKNDLWAVAAPWTAWEQIDPGGFGSDRPISGNALLVADPVNGFLYHFGPGPTALEVWLYVP